MAGLSQTVAHAYWPTQEAKRNLGALRSQGVDLDPDVLVSCLLPVASPARLLQDTHAPACGVRARSNDRTSASGRREGGGMPCMGAAQPKGVHRTCMAPWKCSSQLCVCLCLPLPLRRNVVQWAEASPHASPARPVLHDQFRLGALAASLLRARVQLTRACMHGHSDPRAGREQDGG